MSQDEPGRASGGGHGEVGLGLVHDATPQRAVKVSAADFLHEEIA